MELGVIVRGVEKCTEVCFCVVFRCGVSGGVVMGLGEGSKGM
jgi:hypothetical protein